VVAELDTGSQLCDALVEPGFSRELLALIAGRRKLRGAEGAIAGRPADGSDPLEPEALRPRVVGVEQSNTSIVYGEQLILKLYRRLDEGVSPELEVGRFLRGRFAHTPALAGWLEYQPRAPGREPVTIGLLQTFVPNRGDAWSYTLEELKRFFERVLAKRVDAVVPSTPLALLVDREPPAEVRHMIGAYLEAAGLLGRRSAELHLALAAVGDDQAFNPERFTAHHQRALYQSLRNQAGEALRLLRRMLGSLEEPERRLAQRLLGRRQALLGRGLERFLRARVTVTRIRTHGDLHLGQVLCTGKDFCIIDFEGEPARPLGERRGKRIALRDVAGMIRSFHYAARSGLGEARARSASSRREPAELERWADAWRSWAGWAYLRGYLAAVGDTPIVPRERDELRVLLETFLVEKALYEVIYELNNRPSWVGIPLHGIEEILEAR
jgi:maltose alpha-D-glucosyltransferase/alpha-amylase